MVPQGRSYRSSGKVVKTDEVSITIPMRDGYKVATDWVKLADKASYWTIDTGHNLDMIVLGEVKIELSEAYPPKNLKRDYPDVITAKTLADNTNRDRLKHWKVTS